MKNKKNKSHLFPHTFAGMEQNFQKAEIAIIPVPYDATTSYRPGARDGAQAIINASKNLDEPWGEEGMHALVEKQLVYTFNEVTPHGSSTKEHLDSISNFISEEVIAPGKIPFMLGGEHSLTYAVIKALYEKYKDFSILQFDAHPDLRDSYNGEKFSHACAMRRSIEIAENISLTSVGIRSIDCDTQKYIFEKYHHLNRNIFIFYADALPHRILQTLKKNVYITFDLDAFDPSIMPAVGTPQPGGLLWSPTIKFLRRVIYSFNIIGMDIVELAPIPGNIAPDITAAKLLWQMIEFYYASKYVPAKIG